MSESTKDPSEQLAPPTNWTSAIGLPAPTGAASPVSPEEIRVQIDRLVSDVQRPSIFDPNRRAVDQLRGESIKTTHDLVVGLRKTIAVYVDTQVEDLKKRRNAYLLQKVYDELETLYSTSFRVSTDMLEIFVQNAERIQRLADSSSAITPEILQKQLQAAYDSAEGSQITLRNELRTTIAALAQHWREFMTS